nr:hypothetical protein [Tanacetum cinerariifolium]
MCLCGLLIVVFDQGDYAYACLDGSMAWISKDLKTQYEKDPTCPLLVGREFLAIANAVIDSKKAKIVVGERVTRSIFKVKEINIGVEDVPYLSTIGKRESYTPRPGTDGIGARPPYYAKKDFMDYHLLKVNVQFLQQLQSEWSRFVTIVKQQHKLDEVSYHKLFDILKQYQNEVNELRAEKLARNANPLALVATAQASQDQYYQTSRSHTSTRHKGKEIAKPITPLSETASEEDNDPEQAQRDKDMQKNLALIAKYFKKIYKPTNNNLRTSLNSKNKNVDTTPRKPKRVKDSAYHKEKMLLCKQAEQGVPLQAEQYDWLEDTDEEVDEQELEAHYSYMAKIQEVSTADSGTDSELVEQLVTHVVETDDSNVTPDLPDMCEDDIQNDHNDVESDDERTKQTEFEKYKAFNDRTVDYDKLERKLNDALGQIAHKDTVINEGLKTTAYELLVVKEKHDELMKHSILTKSHYEGIVKQKTKKVSTYNGRPTFANPRYLKQAQSKIPCLYAYPYDQNTHENRLIPDGEETLALERESRSKLNKDKVRPYDYNKLNSLYEIFKPPTQEYETQLAHTNEIRRKT